MREDFRDMLAGNVRLSASHELWNRDVEFLVENWRRSTEKLKKSIDSEKEISEEKLDGFFEGDR